MANKFISKLKFGKKSSDTYIIKDMNAVHTSSEGLDGQAIVKSGNNIIWKNIPNNLIFKIPLIQQGQRYYFNIQFCQDGLFNTITHSFKTYDSNDALKFKVFTGVGISNLDSNGLTSLFSQQQIELNLLSLNLSNSELYYRYQWMVQSLQDDTSSDSSVTIVAGRYIYGRVDGLSQIFDESQQDTLIYANNSVITSIVSGSNITLNNNNGVLTINALAQKIDIDSVLNSTSVNPVQNKVISSALSLKANISTLVNYGTSLDFTIDNDTYVISAVLKNGDNILTSKTIDLPLQTMVISATYQNSTKNLVLKLKNNQIVSCPVGEIIDGLVKDSTTINTKSLSNNITLYGTDININSTSNITITSKILDVQNKIDNIVTSNVDYSKSGIVVSASNANIANKANQLTNSVKIGNADFNGTENITINDMGVASSLHTHNISDINNFNDNVTSIVSSIKASNDDYGVIKVGDGLSVNNGILNANVLQDTQVKYNNAIITSIVSGSNITLSNDNGTLIINALAQKTIVDSSLNSTSVNPVQNKIIWSAIDSYSSKVVSSAINADSASYATSAGSIEWGNINDIPNEFNPISHTHNISDINNFNDNVTSIVSSIKASNDDYGVIKVGDGLSVNNGILNANVLQDTQVKYNNSKITSIVSGSNITLSNNNGILTINALAQKIDIDSALDNESINPVQNKVIYNALDSKLNIPVLSGSDGQAIVKSGDNIIWKNIPTNLIFKIPLIQQGQRYYFNIQFCQDGLFNTITHSFKTYDSNDALNFKAFTGVGISNLDSNGLTSLFSQQQIELNLLNLNLSNSELYYRYQWMVQSLQSSDSSDSSVTIVAGRYIYGRVDGLSQIFDESQQDTLIYANNSKITSIVSGSNVTLSNDNGVLTINALAQKIDIDSALNSTSVNPVQNKVIYSSLSTLVPVKKIYVDSSTTSKVITNVQGNAIYKCGTLTSMVISSVQNSDYETNIYFTAGSSISVNMPASLQFIGENQFLSSKKYVINILNNVAVIGQIGG